MKLEAGFFQDCCTRTESHARFCSRFTATARHPQLWKSRLS